MSEKVEEGIKSRLAVIERLLASSDEAKRAKAKQLYEEFRKQHGGAYVPEISTPDCPTGQHFDPATQECVPDTPSGCPELPEDGRPQPQKKANKDPNTWKVVAMKDDATKFKVVDDANVNVADQFNSQATAEQYIAHYKCVPPVPIPTPDPTPTPTPDGGQLGPYPSTGKELGATTRRATRHYASGKPDDETVEKNTKDIPYQKYQSIYYVTMHGIEHDDNISTKLGGTHMGSGWFDHGISFQEGQTCLGYEPEHPTTHSCVIKGPKLGSIIEKRTGVSAVYDKTTNHTELWIRLEGGSWQKALESDDVDGFNPNNKDDNDETQLRIDGFTDGSDPTIDVAVVQEIA